MGAEFRENAAILVRHDFIIQYFNIRRTAIRGSVISPTAKKYINIEINVTPIWLTFKPILNYWKLNMENLYCCRSGFHIRTGFGSSIVDPTPMFISISMSNRKMHVFRFIYIS